MLHCLDNMLMLPSRDQSFLAGGALMLDGATLTGVGPIAAQNQAFVLSHEVIGELLASRTDINILCCHIAEVLFTEAPLRL